MHGRRYCLRRGSTLRHTYVHVMSCQRSVPGTKASAAAACSGICTWRQTAPRFIQGKKHQEKHTQKRTDGRKPPEGATGREAVEVDSGRGCAGHTSWNVNMTQTRAYRWDGARPSVTRVFLLKLNREMFACLLKRWDESQEGSLGIGVVATPPRAPCGFVTSQRVEKTSRSKASIRTQQSKIRTVLIACTSRTRSTEGIPPVHLLSPTVRDSRDKSTHQHLPLPPLPLLRLPLPPLPPPALPPRLEASRCSSSTLGQPSTRGRNDMCLSYIRSIVDKHR